MTKEPWEKVRAVFKEKNLIKEKDNIMENVLMKKCNYLYNIYIGFSEKEIQEQNIRMC